MIILREDGGFCCCLSFCCFCFCFFFCCFCFCFCRLLQGNVAKDEGGGDAQPLCLKATGDYPLAT